jgi:hypothetical protein
MFSTEQQNGPFHNLHIVGNSINLNTPFASGIEIAAPQVMPEDAVIADNQVSTGGNGLGLNISLGGPMTLLVQGNDFHNNKFGVATQGSGSAANIDLGGGNQGSLGQNDFRSFTATASVAGSAISVNSNATGAANSLSAQNNLFASGVTPANVVSDDSPNKVLNVADGVTGNAAFVATLYNEILKRPADLTNPNGAGSWVNALNSHALTQAMVARDITHSTEALDTEVNGLYLRFLHRNADMGGLAAARDAAALPPQSPAAERRPRSGAARAIVRADRTADPGRRLNAESAVCQGGNGAARQRSHGPAFGYRSRDPDHAPPRRALEPGGRPDARDRPRSRQSALRQGPVADAQATGWR